MMDHGRMALMGRYLETFWRYADVSADVIWRISVRALAPASGSAPHASPARCVVVGMRSNVSCREMHAL